MKRTLIFAAVVILAIGGYLGYRHHTQAETPAYRFGNVERGDVEAVISATGALSAVKTVQVGTQVSGQIAATYVDFNDHVKKGQLIARIDPMLQKQAVDEAQAGLDRNRAQLEQARVEYERNKRLFDDKVLTEVEFNTAKYNYESAKANTKSAEVALQRAKQNLDYTSIYSPIDGVVVERDVDVGQTVAASYATPQLFLIAQDLSQMQILASVDESDIGQIKEGQTVHFSVQAYPKEKFEGVVKQVRLQSKTTENVVNYTVAVAVQNSGKLLPSMTATVEFVTGSASNALTVPNAALRFRPPQEVLDKLRAQRKAKMGENGKGAGGEGVMISGGGAGGMQAGPPAGGGNVMVFGGDGGSGPRRNPNNMRRNSDHGMLWLVDAKGELTPLPVRLGITDGQRTVVLSKNPELKEGLQVVTGSEQAEAAAASNNPFQGPMQQRGGPNSMRRGPF